MKNRIYALRIGESNKDFINKKMYACTAIYRGMIDVVTEDGFLLTHDVDDSDFTIFINLTNTLIEILGFEIVE